MGKKFPRLYYMNHKKKDDRTYLESIDIYTKQIFQHGPLPKNYWITSINADETLALGFSEQPLVPAKKYNGKADKIYNRYLEKIPMTLFTVNLSSKNFKDIYLSTDWLSHPQFSPTNPSLIMYSIEGPWHLVDRIWTINSDGSNNQLIHKRTLPMEIAGHEFWSKDGKNILYDWQQPKGKEFYLASYNVETKQRTSASVNGDHCSVHYNGSNNDSLMVGDGERESQDLCSKNSSYIFKYRVETKDGVAGTEPIKALISEPLVDLRGHNYGMLEPNLRLSNDQHWVIFMSNMFGNSGVFAVELEKPTKKNKPVVSTKDLAALRLQRYTEMVRVR
jgi:oligogalacturonide lyase